MTGSRATGPRSAGRRRPVVESDAGLVEWVRAFAELSHRTVEDVVGSLPAAERSRIEAHRTSDPGDPSGADRTEDAD
ncbi:hypothetical protein ACFWOG_38300 [Kitasatospora sp. NPDC058406]|uniref:hypothetical protein n=1 Tax=Kitasatospora sp. NPDC058406 TaxID=3346483 RepID=UPI00365A7FED